MTTDIKKQQRNKSLHKRLDALLGIENPLEEELEELKEIIKNFAYCGNNINPNVAKFIFDSLELTSMEKILIVNCTASNLLLGLKNHCNKRIYAIEREESKARVSKKIVKDQTVIYNNFLEQEFEDESFDVVICCPELDKVEAYFEKCIKVLRDKCKLVIFLPEWLANSNEQYFSFRKKLVYYYSIRAAITLPKHTFFRIIDDNFKSSKTGYVLLMLQKRKDETKYDTKRYEILVTDIGKMENGRITQSNHLDDIVKELKGKLWIHRNPFAKAKRYFCYTSKDGTIDYDEKLDIDKIGQYRNLKVIWTSNPSNIVKCYKGRK